MSKSSSGKSATVTTHYDGGGGNKVDIPESEFIDTRETPTGTEALVEIGGDGGGKNTEWVPVTE